MTEVYTFDIQFWFLQMSVNLKTQQCKPSKMKYGEEKRKQRTQQQQSVGQFQVVQQVYNWTEEELKVI